MVPVGMQECNGDGSFCLFIKVGVLIEGLNRKKIEAKRTVPSCHPQLSGAWPTLDFSFIKEKCNM